MTLPIAARNPLIEISAALHAKDSRLVEQRINDAPVEARNKIYNRVWQVMDRPDTDRYGEQAFHDPGFPAELKIKAVETVILEDVEPMPAREKPVQPPNSVEVKMPAFWDTGFDPRFDKGGNFLLEGTPKRTLRQVIVDVVAYWLFVFKAYCSPFSEERTLRKAILSGASLEKIWSSYYVRALVNNMDDPCLNWIPLAEHDFLENAGDIWRRLIPYHQPLRPFPREVILPIHRMNKPQNAEQVFEKMQPGQENEDLVRMGYSFLRLNKGAYTLPGKEKGSLELFKYDYVPHFLFTHATRQKAENLKLACRELRQQIAKTPTDFKCAFSFAACKTKLGPVFEQFNRAWYDYYQSHELLRENQVVWSQTDYRAEEYAALRAETKLSPEKADELRRIKGRPSEQAYDTCQGALKIAYAGLNDGVKTSRMLRALQEKSSTPTGKT